MPAFFFGEDMSIECAVVCVPMFQDGPSEDAYRICADADPPFMVVADGHGCAYDEHNRRVHHSKLISDFASQAVDEFASSFHGQSRQDELEELFTSVDSVLSAWQYRLVPASKPGVQSMGVVVSLVAVTAHQLLLAQVGDCRLYCLSPRNGSIQLLSQDHHLKFQSELSRLSPFFNSGELGVWTKGNRLRVKNKTGTSALQITRSIGDWGFGPGVTHLPECRTFPFDPNAIYALCSDGANGLFENLQPDEIARITTLDRFAWTLERSCTWIGDDVTIILFREMQ